MIGCSGKTPFVPHSRLGRRPTFSIPTRVGNAFAMAIVSTGGQITPSKSQLMRSSGSVATSQFAQQI
jgi:hypothetical protein